VAVDDTSSYIASASGDGSVRIWGVNDGECRSIMDGRGGDVYSVRWRPGKEVCFRIDYRDSYRRTTLLLHFTIRSFDYGTLRPVSKSEHSPGIVRAPLRSLSITQET